MNISRPLRAWAVRREETKMPPHHSSGPGSRAGEADPLETFLEADRKAGEEDGQERRE